ALRKSVGTVCTTPAEIVLGIGSLYQNGSTSCTRRRISRKCLSAALLAGGGRGALDGGGERVGGPEVIQIRFEDLGIGGDDGCTCCVGYGTHDTLVQQQAVYVVQVDFR